MLDSIGVDDEALEGVVYRESLRPLLARLAPRERQILMLRFFRNMTQSQIADEIGISQMHVSRLLAKTLAELRGGPRRPVSRLAVVLSLRSQRPSPEARALQ